MSFLALLVSVADDVAKWRSYGMPDAEVRTHVMNLYTAFAQSPINDADVADQIMAGVTARIDEELAKPRNDVVPSTDGDPGLN